MKYIELAELYEKLEKTTKKLEKRDILADFYKKCPVEKLYKVVLLSMGVVFPAGELELGIASEMMKRIIIKTCGISEHELTKKFKETGDLGSTAEFFIKNKRQKTLAKKELTIDIVFDNLRKLPEITGKGSQDKKMELVSELLSCATPKEARYIVRTTLGEMRIGVAAGVVRDAIAKAFDRDVKEIEKSFDVIGDFGRVAEMAKKGKIKIEIQVGRPVRVMLAERALDLRSAMEKFEHPALEVKYDGFRMAIHKDGDNIKLFSRRLDDVTNQFPEIIKWSKENIKAKECIVEGEVLAINPNTGRPLPFQQLSRRIQRKYNIEKMVKEIPVQINLFEMIYLNGESWMHKTLRERWNKLKEIIKETKYFRLADHLETKDYKKAEEFYKRSLEMGEEGVIVKNLDAHYQPGKRVGFWLKVKPIMEPLDLVITGATWGEGKRAKWLGSLVLAAKSGDNFLETGMLGSGLTEEQLDEVTKKLKPLIIEEHGKEVKIKPELVVEVAYEEIQKSPKYPSGFALRFPRLLRIREPEDKGPEDINTVKDIEKLFIQQRGRKK
ncbi:MAG: ATP-dependent DNA ligase [Candidatus Aenigmatarchaeota archaeon]